MPLLQFPLRFITSPWTRDSVAPTLTQPQLVQPQQAEGLFQAGGNLAGASGGHHLPVRGYMAFI